MRMVRITGTTQVIKNLTNSKLKIGYSLERGMKKAGLYLLRASQKMVPVQTGHLKNSGFVRSFGSGLHTDVVVGYEAEYAAYVHEDLTKAHGKDFNIKHRDEIAKAGKINKKGRWHPTLKSGTAAGGMFPRGENQQAKFLEKPGRENRKRLLQIIAVG